MLDSTKTETAREGLFRKIRALLAKTTDAGCTEEEALSAASLARRLMDDYNIAHADLEEPDPWAEQDFPQWASGRRPRARALRWSLRREIFSTVGRYCDCRALITETNQLRYFGRESDVLFAGWLLESLDAFGLRSWALFEAAQGLSDEPFTADRESFLLAFSQRICERLRDEIAARTAPETTGSALILNRNALRDSEYRSRYPALGRARGQGGRNADPASYAAGGAAAARASFHRPMAGSRGPVLIGR